MSVLSRLGNTVFAEIAVVVVEVQANLTDSMHLLQR